MEWVDLWQLLLLKTFMVGHGASSASSYLTDPTSPIPSHCAVVILCKSVPVHQLSWLAIQEIISVRNKVIAGIVLHRWLFLEFFLQYFKKFP